MRKRDRSDEPVLLRDAVATVGRDLGMPEPDVFATLTAAWPEIIGAELEPHVALRSLRDGTCTVEVDGPGWATQLRYAEQQLVERANERCGAGMVTAIRVVSNRPGSAFP